MASSSAFSLSTSSCRPAFSYCSIESRLCFTSERKSFCISSSSSSEPFSICRFIIAALTMRSVDVRLASCAFIDAVRSEQICLLRLIFQNPPAVACYVPVRLRKVVAQKSTGVRLGNAHDLFRRPDTNYVTAGIATFRTKIDDVIRGLDHVEIMLDHQQ